MSPYTPLRSDRRALVAVLALLGACASDPPTPDDAAPHDGAIEDDATDGAIHDVIDDTPPDATPDATSPGDADVRLDAPDAAPPRDADVRLDAERADVRPDARPDAAAPDAAPPRDAAVPPPPTSALLLDGASPMPCADPALVSVRNADATFYVYCTGMAHVWRTSDWVRFDDVRPTTRFDLGGMSDNGRQIGSWWAPGVVYAPDLNRYVMWVSVPAAAAVRGDDGWDARALAVLTATEPTGPWVFRAMAQGASRGQHFIDPFLFRDHDGRRYVYWKQYGGGVPSRIMGAAVDATWQGIVAGSRVEIMDGFGGAGTWEDNVRENPAVVYDADADRHHLLFSGGHWAENGYATAHALSACGPLCVAASRGGWHMAPSGDRGILQVVRTFGDADFRFGGPGGAEFQGRDALHIVYAAAARSARGDQTRYLMRDRVRWRSGAPYVDTAGHRPLGY